MGHLPLADQAEPEANAPAVASLRHARRAIIHAGFDPPLTHLAATAATLTDPATHFAMVRVGAGLVDIDPSETIALHGACRLTARGGAQRDRAGGHTGRLRQPVRPSADDQPVRAVGNQSR